MYKIFIEKSIKINNITGEIINWSYKPNYKPDKLYKLVI